MARLSETFWAWLAGFIDGDGHMGVYPAGATLEIVNTDLVTLEWLQTTLGYGSITKLTPGSGRQRQAYKWSCYAKGMRVVLPKILPYLRTKHDRAVLLLEFLDRARPGKKRSPEELAARKDLKERIAALNRRSYSKPHPTERPLGGTSTWGDRV